MLVSVNGDRIVKVSDAGRGVVLIVTGTVPGVVSSEAGTIALSSDDEMKVVCSDCPFQSTVVGT